MSESLAERKTGTLEAIIEGDDFKQKVAKALPKHLPPDRFIRIACTAMMRTPKLKECEQVSFVNALLSLSQLGLEPDGRRAHLIPFNNTKRGVVECQLIVDYKGLVELAMRSGNVANIHADVVCENDDFVYDRGQIAKHTINFRKPRGKVYAAYATVRFKDGTEKTEVMSHDEIEAIRGRSKAGNFGPWQTDWNEMAKKTVFRRLSKWITLSPEYHDILEKDFDSFDRIELNPKANIIPPPKKRAEQPVIEAKVESVAEPEPEREPVKVQQGETEPPADVTLATDDPDRPNFADDIYGRLDSMIYDYCKGNTNNMKSVYKTLTTFTGSDGKERYCLDVEQLKRWKPTSAEKAKRQLEQRMAMGTKFKFELE